MHEDFHTVELDKEYIKKLVREAIAEEKVLAQDAIESENFSIRLAPEFAQKLEQLAKDQDISINSAIQRAIATEDFVKTQLKQGSKILVQRPDQTLTEVIFTGY